MLNLTPHAIVLGGVTIPPTGQVARVEMAETETGTGPDGQTGHVAVIVQRPGRVLDLPDAEAGVTYLVSQMVAVALPARRDLYFPARMVRDTAGRVVGATALGQVPVACTGLADPAVVPELVEALRGAVARVELANGEGDPILSAWLPDAKALLARLEGGEG